MGKQCIHILSVVVELERQNKKLESVVVKSKRNFDNINNERNIRTIVNEYLLRMEAQKCIRDEKQVA